MQYSRYHMDQETIGWVLIWSKLHFHGSELNPPSYIVINGYFQSYRIPISAIEHLKQVTFLFAHLFKLGMAD